MGLDNLSLVIILRSLFIYILIEKGWIVRKYKNGTKNTFEIYKSVKKT
jgi:hypothetical protein